MTGERELAPVETLRLYGMSERSAETFIARVKAEAWDEGAAKGSEVGADAIILNPMHTNPYRKEDGQ